MTPHMLQLTMCCTTSLRRLTSLSRPSIVPKVVQHDGIASCCPGPTHLTHHAVLQGQHMHLVRLQATCAALLHYFFPSPRSRQLVAPLTVSVQQKEDG